MVVPNPILLFNSWFKEASATVKDADSMVFATASREGMPFSRIVRLGSITSEGISFMLPLESKQLHQLQDNPYAALCLHWALMERQVRLEGKVKNIEAGRVTLSVERIEFWQEGKYRLHKRIVYTKTVAGEWTTERLYP